MRLKLFSPMLLISIILLGGCAVPPVSCECEKELIRSQRGEPDHIREYKSYEYTFTVWTYHRQRAEYEFVLEPFGCEVRSDIRTSPTY